MELFGLGWAGMEGRDDYRWRYLNLDWIGLDDGLYPVIPRDACWSLAVWDEEAGTEHRPCCWPEHYRRGSE